MRKLYNEFFYVSKHGKVRDKVMITRVAVTVFVMIACLFAMSITAYAYFSHNVTSNSNIIKAANFEADVAISITDQNNEAVTVNEIDSKTRTADLKAGVTYDITLSHAGTATTGFYTISAENCVAGEYHTQQLGIYENATDGVTDKFVFKLKVTNDATVKFCACWGTSSRYFDYVNNGDNDGLYITADDKIITMEINGTSDSDSETEQKETASSETTPPTTSSDAAKSTDTEETITPTGQVDEKASDETETVSDDTAQQTTEETQSQQETVSSETTQPTTSSDAAKSTDTEETITSTESVDEATSTQTEVAAIETQAETEEITKNT